MTMHNNETEISSESHDSDSFSDFYKAYGNRKLDDFSRSYKYSPKTVADLKTQAIVTYLKELDERVSFLEESQKVGPWD